MGSFTREHQGGASTSGRVASPRLLKDPTTFEALASRLNGWTPNAASSAPASSRASPTQIRLNSATRAQGSGGLFEEEEEGGLSGSHVGAEVERDAPWPTPPGDDSVTYSAWDELEGDGEDFATRRVLLQAYEPSGFVIWDCSTLDSWFEILRLDSLEGSLRPDFASRFPRGLGSIVGTSILPTPISSNAEDPWTESRPLIAIATHLRSTNEAQVVLYSLRSHQIVHTLASPLPGTPHQLQSNARHLVLSTSSPLALHVLSATTFTPTAFSPIIDLAPSPFDGAPVWNLGQGGRALAYATERAVVAVEGAARFDREPVKPGAGILAQRGMFDLDSHGVGEAGYDDHGGLSGGASGERSAGQVGGEVARRVGEGVLKGAKVIGDIGFSYWSARNQQFSSSSPEVVESNGGRNCNFSKSAPVPSVTGWERRGSTSSAGALSPKLSMARLSSSHGAESATAGTIIVVDLLSYPSCSVSSSKSRARKSPRSTSPSLKTLAHFRPYSRPIALLSLSPSSSSILTSSTLGHSFDIFDLKPSVKIGASQGTSSSSRGKVWHRYRLHRGVTSAKATRASWAADGRFVGVGTGKGTTHIFAIEPFGGKPQLDDHFAAKVTNALELPPLSVTLSTIARVRPSNHRRDERERSRFAHNPASLCPTVAFVSKADSLDSSFRRAPASRLTSPIITPQRYRSSPSSKTVPLPSASASTTTSFQDLLVFYPHSSLVILERLSASPAPVSTVDAASRGDVGRMATTAVSGLSQLMKSRGAPAGQVHAPAKVDWVVACSAKAEWEVGREGEGEVRESVEVAEMSPKGALAGRYSAQAEIETFSRSVQVLPRSIYLSQQFDFFALPPAPHSLPSSASLALFLPTLRHLSMRSSVQVRPGSSSPSFLPVPLSPTTSLSPPTDALDEPHSLDQPIKSAMQTILDAYPAEGTSGSPSQSAAGFPNGVAGKSGSTRWRDALPIHAAHVNAGLAMGLSVAGRLGRGAVQVAQAGAGAAAARRASRAEDVTCSSVSFEEDAVFAEYREEGTDSTAATSERGSAGEECAEEEDEAWGLGLDEEVEVEVEEGVTHEGMPFEDDFDDFELALDRPTKVATVVPDLLLSHSTRTASIHATSSVPIIDFDGAHSTSSLERPAVVAPASSDSPVKESHHHLLDELSPTASPLVSGSPSSFSSSASAAASAAGAGKKSKGRKKK